MSTPSMLRWPSGCGGHPQVPLPTAASVGGQRASPSLHVRCAAGGALPPAPAAPHCILIRAYFVRGRAPAGGRAGGRQTRCRPSLATPRPVFPFPRSIPRSLSAAHPRPAPVSAPRRPQPPAPPLCPLAAARRGAPPVCRQTEPHARHRLPIAVKNRRVVVVSKGTGCRVQLAARWLADIAAQVSVCRVW